MKLKNLLIAVAGALAVIGVLLPWYSVSLFGISASANGFTGDWAIFGVLSLLMGIAIAVIAGINYSKDLPKWAKITNTVLGAVICCIALLVIAGLGSIGASAGFGLYLLIIAGVAAIVLQWVKIDMTLGEDKKATKKSSK